MLRRAQLTARSLSGISGMILAIELKKKLNIDTFTVRSCLRSKSALLTSYCE